MPKHTAQYGSLSFAALAALILLSGCPSGTPSSDIVDYEWVTQFGVMGTGDGEFDRPFGIGVDANDLVYITDRENDRIQVFDNNPLGDGRFITKWGSFGTNDGQFFEPHGVDFDSLGNVYIADSGNNRMQKFNSTGTFLLKWGALGNGDGEFAKPWDVAIDNADNVYVADYTNDRIQKFDSDGTFITRWGTTGDGPGQFDSPHGITVDSEDNVYVVDFSNHRVQKFDANGNFLLQWGMQGQVEGGFVFPRAIAVNSMGDVYVTDDAKQNQVLKFIPVFGS